MKTITKFFVAAVALFGVATAANAKNPDNIDNNVSPDTEQVAEHDMNVYGSNYTDGDKFDGLTRKVGFDRMIPSHALEVCYNKTTHIIFPAEITYVDLGNENLVAGLADGAKNVLRVKSAFKSFKQETNLSLITEDGSYYTFNVKFAKEPLLLGIEMTDFLHDGGAVNRPNNAQEIFLERLGVSDACQTDYEVNSQAEQARNQAYRLKAFRRSVPTEIHLHKQWASILSHRTEEYLQHRFRHRLC